MQLGLYEYLFTPYRLSNAVLTFQRMMDRTTDGLEGVFAYMDDSRVGSPDRQTHLCHLKVFFTALADNGLSINLKKCVFAAPSLEILGHKILVTGAAPYSRSRRRNRKLPPPLRISSNCNVFLSAQILKPLTDLLKGGAKTL
jgi:hypothetical protein